MFESYAPGIARMNLVQFCLKTMPLIRTRSGGKLSFSRMVPK